jgi:hypothetical protein
MPPILRMALNDLCPRRRVRPDLPFNRRPNRGSDPAAKSTPEPTNQRVECSAPSLPANDNR